LALRSAAIFLPISFVSNMVTSSPKIIVQESQGSIFLNTSLGSAELIYLIYLFNWLKALTIETPLAL
jgi:hypothetical protein